MRFKFLSMLSVFYLFQIAQAEELTITKAAEKAVKASQDVKKAVYSKDEAIASLKEVKNLKWGRINLKTTYTNGDEPVYSFAETLRQGKFSMASMATVNNPPSIENTEIAIEGGIPLFTGFALTNYEKMGDLGKKAANSYYERTVSAIKFKAAWLYLTAVLRNNLLSEIEKTLASSREELDSADRLNKSGMIPGSDYYAALAIYSGLENYKNILEGDFNDDLSRLAAETGVNKDELKISGELSKPFYEELNCQNLFTNLAERRRDIVAYKLFSQIANIKADVEKNSILPEIQAFGAFYGNSGALDSMKTSGIYGLKLNLPIGDPTYFARKEKAMAKARQSEMDYESSLKNARISLNLSCSDYVSSLKSAKLSKETVEKAGKSLELFKPLYAQGKQSIMEVLRAENALFQAKASYYEAVYKTHLFYLKTLFEAEQLNEESISKIEKNISF